MQVTPIKTHPITIKDTSIFSVLDQYLPPLTEKSIVVVTSKIVAICEGRVADPEKVTKDELVKREAEWYLPRSMSKYDFCISINNQTMVASAGVDESNGNGLFVLWPKDLQKSANLIREHIIKTQNLKEVGVIITDSKTTPLRWGVTGISLAHSGFKALNSYIGKPDIFGRFMKAEQLNIADSLASAAVVVMGEGREQTPLAVITDTPFITFQKRNPTTEELAELVIVIEDDIYAPLLTSVPWEKGKDRK